MVLDANKTNANDECGDGLPDGMGQDACMDGVPKTYDGMVEATTIGSMNENDDGLELVEEYHGDDLQNKVAKINTKTKQGTIKNFCIDMNTFGGATPTKTGGGIEGGGTVHSLVEPRLKDACVTNRYGMTTKGSRKKAVAKRSKTKLGPKSKTGKDPRMLESVSNQQGIMGFFSLKQDQRKLEFPGEKQENILKTTSH